MLFTGETIAAEEALLYGLVSELVDDGNEKDSSQAIESTTTRLELRVNEVAKQVAANTSRSVVALGKKCLREQVQKSHLNDAYRVASQTMIENLKLKDTQLGLKAFAEKKKPVWTHSSEKVAQE